MREFKKAVSMFLSVCMIISAASYVSADDQASELSENDAAVSEDISENVKIVYEDFNYGEGNQLNAVDAAKEADEIKGFASGWTGNVALDAEIGDNYTVGTDGILEIKPSTKFPSIYRELANKISLNSDNIYLITWDMRLNSGATNAGTQTQKFVLTNKGVSTNTSQIQVGFVGGRVNSEDTGYSPYMRVQSTLLNNDKISIVKDKLYHLILVIEANKSGNDRITYGVCDSKWNILQPYLQSSLDIGSEFSVIGYHEWVGGSGLNAVGNISVEQYGSAQRETIAEIQEKLEAAKENVSVSDAEEANTMLQSLPDGILSDILASQVSEVMQYIADENEKLRQLEEEVAAIGNLTVSADNLDSINEKMEEFAAQIETVQNASIKESLEKTFAETKKKIQESVISAVKSTEDFSYTSGTQASDIGEDVENGWRGGYFADEQLSVPVSDFEFGEGICSFNENAFLYRQMTYPVTSDEQYNSYIRWNFKLENGGSVKVQTGDISAVIADKPRIEYGDKTETLNLGIEYGKDYTAIMKLSYGKVKLTVFPSDNYSENVSAETDYSGKITESVIGFGGENAVISLIEKENAGIEYTAEAEEALSAMMKTMLEAEVEAAKQAAEALKPCILQDTINKAVQSVTEIRESTLPQIRSVGIQGTGRVGSVLNAVCSIDDPLQNLQKTEISWMCGSTCVGTGTSFTVPTDCTGKRIHCEAVVYNTAGKQSEPYKSSAITVITSAGSTSVSTGGGGGGGPSGGYSGTVKSIPEAIYFPEATASPEPSAETTGFKDIIGHWSEDVVNRMTDKGIVKGFSEDEFRPDAPITRAEFTALLVRSLEIPSSDVSEFSDISSDDWYYEDICAASGEGLIEGWDGNFYPSETITREAMAKIVFMAYTKKNLPETPGDEETVFSDETEMSDWSREYIKKLCAVKLLSGIGENKFAPKNSLTRAEAATVLERLMDMIESNSQ